MIFDIKIELKNSNSDIFVGLSPLHFKKDQKDQIILALEWGHFGRFLGFSDFSL